jgi:hypothetical protein
VSPPSLAYADGIFPVPEHIEEWAVHGKLDQWSYFSHFFSQRTADLKLLARHSWRRNRQFVRPIRKCLGAIEAIVSVEREVPEETAEEFQGAKHEFVIPLMIHTRLAQTNHSNSQSRLDVECHNATLPVEL